ncbi:transglutaminase family protein [Solicola sp. PLA-1-18]|uniref:transglutaminase family protein n=1 Tax=Solicola sp. PLA-1-18 TaxID=3380532 RepID=UPI003B77BDA7
MRIAHRTGFTYVDGVNASYNEARMTPLTLPEQYVLHSRLDVTPNPWTYTYSDYWGTQVTAFEVHELHQDLTVTSTSTVDVGRRPVEPAGLSWADLRDPVLVDRHVEMLDLGPRVVPPDSLAARTREIAAAAGSPSVFARDLCGFVHSEITYVTGATLVETTAADAWESRTGVCQDIAHLVLGGLRAAGVPARYVSGYLHPREDPEVGETVAGESHAWIEWFDGDWVGFDPTNDVVPGDRHVVVGRGRSYDDIAPLRGIFSGSVTSDMAAEVQVTRLT